MTPIHENKPFINFDFVKILIVYSIQTGIYFILCKNKMISSKQVAGGPEVSFVLMGVSLLVIVKGYDGRYSYSKCCSDLLFIYFFIFKIYFFMYLFYIVEVIDISTLYCSKSESTEAKKI